MIKYAVKKLFTMIITIILVSFLVFLAFEMIPGDPALNKLGTGATPEALMKLRAEMGLDRPLVVRYISWIAGLFTGDMGMSYSYSMPVGKMIADKLPITITLTLISFILIVAISIPIGIYTAEHNGSIISNIIDVTNQIFMAIPSFFAGMIITYFFGLILRLFTPGGFVSYKDNFGKFIWYLLFPAVAIALPKIAMTVRMLKSSVLSEAKLDYVRTAYSKGNSTKAVLYKHVLKNAFIPVVTFLGMTLSDMVAGSLIVEQVFSIPGFGRLLVTSIANRDYPVVQSIIVIIATIVIVVNLLVDITYRIIDPRTRHE